MTFSVIFPNLIRLRRIRAVEVSIFDQFSSNLLFSGISVLLRKKIYFYQGVGYFIEHSRLNLL